MSHRGGFEPLEQRLLFSVFTVTSLADDSSGSTLRDAVNAANASTDPTNTINFAPGLTGAITLTQGQLELDSGDTIIQGPGAGALTVSGDNASTVFRVDFGVTADISGLTIADGSGGIGAGVDNSGTLSVENSVFSDNVASGGEGGAIYNSGTLTITDSTFSDNNSGFGGAIYANSDNLDITGSTFTGNSADQSGGAIDANFATVSVVNSTLSGNTTTGQGGALYDFDSTITLTNATVADNTATTDGGGIHVEPGTGDLTLYNTIVASNTLTDGVTASDITGTVDTSLATGQAPSSNNLIGAGGAAGLVNGTDGNQVGVANPGLGALTNNGGPTETMALLTGSPAIDAGSNALAVDANGNALTTDQRGSGFARIINNTVDIGAFESAAPVIITTNNPIVTVSAVTATDGQHVKLMATLTDSKGNPLKHQVITFSLDGTVVGTAKTNCDGVAKLCTHVDVTPGTYATGVEAAFAATSTYAAASATAALTVSDAPIRACGIALSLSKSKAAALVEFTQADPGVTAADFTATIDWGDGSGPMPVTITGPKGHCDDNRFEILANHTYPVTKTKETYTVTVVITSVHGATKTLTEKLRQD